MKTIICDDTKEIASNYKDYLKTKHWIKLKAEFRNKTKVEKCVMCGYDKMLNIHHMTYENLGHEPLSDLVYLCKMCHNKLHDSIGTTDTKILKKLKDHKHKIKKTKVIRDCSLCIDCYKGRCLMGYENKNNNCKQFKPKKYQKPIVKDKFKQPKNPKA